MADAKVELTDKVTDAVATAVSNPGVRADLSAVPAIVAALGPVIDSILHSTNNEPWYRSRVTWSAIMVLVSAVLGAFRIAFPAELQSVTIDLILSVCLPITAGIGVFVGRYLSKKPIGS